MKRTTDYGELKNGAQYVWGQVAGFHEVGAYRIVEYHPRRVEGCTVTRDIDYGKLYFSLYTQDGTGNVSNRSEGYESLDAALAGGITLRAEGPNHHADRYFMLALEALRKP